MKGFTLLELLCVIGVLAAISTFSLPVGISTFQNLQEHFYAHTLSLAVRSVRSSSMHKECITGYCQTPQNHGVHVSSSTFTLYTGPSFILSDTLYDTQLPYTGTSFVNTVQDVSFGLNGIPVQATTFTFGMSPASEMVVVDVDGDVSVSSR